MDGGDCIVLVHGTWGSASPWTKEHSRLVTALRSMQPSSVHVARFEWSGRNCHKERRRAARRLGAWLRSSEMAGFDHVHLIGHSHGGNVALASARLAKERVTSIVTVGTPFISSRIRESYLSEDPIRLLLIPICYLALIPLALLMFGFVDVAPAEHWSNGVLFSILFSCALFGPGFVADWAADPISRLVDRRHAPKARRRYRAFAAAAAPALCIFDDLDEARRAIRLSLIASSRLKIAAWIAGSFCGLIQLLVIICALIGWLWYPPILQWGSVSSDSPWFAPAIAFTIGFWVLALSSFFVLIAGGTMTAWFSAFSLGWRSAIDLLYLQLRVSAFPEGGEVQGYRVRSATRRRLFDFRHTLLCRNEEVIGVIIDWLAGRRDVAPPASGAASRRAGRPSAAPPSRCFSSCADNSRS